MAANWNRDGLYHRAAGRRDLPDFAVVARGKAPRRARIERVLRTRGAFVLAVLLARTRTQNAMEASGRPAHVRRFDSAVFVGVLLRNLGASGARTQKINSLFAAIKRDCRDHRRNRGAETREPRENRGNRAV